MNWKKVKFMCVALIGFAMLATTAEGAVLASDNADDAVYSGVTGTIYDLDGGTGFGEWVRYYGNSDALDVVNASEYLPTIAPTYYEGATSRAFGLVSAGNYGIAQRSMSSPMDVGDVFSVSIDADPTQTNPVGIYFYDNGYSTSGQRQLFIENKDIGGVTNWWLKGYIDTGIPRDAGSVNLSLEITDPNSYNFTLTSQALDVDGVTPLYSYSSSGDLWGTQVNGIDRFKIANLAPSDYPNRFATYFNNFSVLDSDGTTTNASDNALNTAYDAAYVDGGSIEGLNGGTGFNAWETIYGTMCVNLDATYGITETPLPFEKTFHLAGGNDNVPSRVLDEPLDTGDTFSVVLKKTVPETAGQGTTSWLGVNLYNSDHFNSGDVRVLFGDSMGTGTGNWCIWNRSSNSLILDTNIEADDTPIRVAFTVTGEETYDMSVEVWDYETGDFGAPHEFSDLAMTSTGLGALDCFRVYNMKGSGDLLFNDITVSDAAVPEPGTLMMILLGASLVCLFRKRNK